MTNTAVLSFAWTVYWIQNPQALNSSPCTMALNWGRDKALRISPVVRSLSLLWDDQGPQEGQRMTEPLQLLKRLSVGSSHCIMRISENPYSGITCWDLKSAGYPRKWSGYLQHSELLCLMTVLLSVALHKHLSQLPASARISSHSVKVPQQL